MKISISIDEATLAALDRRAELTSTDGRGNRSPVIRRCLQRYFNMCDDITSALSDDDLRPLLKMLGQSAQLSLDVVLPLLERIERDDHKLGKIAEWVHKRPGLFNTLALIDRLERLRAAGKS